MSDKLDRSKLHKAALRILNEIVEKPLHKSRTARRDWLAPPPLSVFRRLEPLGFGLHDPLDANDWGIFHPDDCTPDVEWPLDVGVAFGDFFEGNGDLRMHRCRTVTFKEVRGYAARFSKYMVRNDHADMDRGELLCASGLSAWIGDKWVDANPRTFWEGEIPHRTGIRAERSDNMAPRTMTSIALRQRYEWGAALGLPGGPSVRFDTDPTGVKAIFRIRDLPEGKDRREALKHWVLDHWRQHRSDPELEIYVRAHLRGAVQFNWRGLECELLASRFDQEKHERLKEEREAMRNAGTDRRTRA